MDMNQSKVNTRKQVQSNASPVAPTILTIELNVQLPVRLALSVANKATPGYVEGGESACESVSDSDESIFVTERVGVVSSNMAKSSFMVPLTFHTEYSPVITTQLDTGATCSAMSYTEYA